MWEKIKNILSKQGGKCIIIEDNQPTYLVMKLDDYEGALAGNNLSEIEKANRDIARWRERQTPDLSQVVGKTEEIKVEDLPF